MAFVIVTILAGLIASSSLIVEKQPNAKEVFQKIAPFQGGFGVVVLVWGLYQLFQWFRAFSAFSDLKALGIDMPLVMWTFLILVLLSIALGLILSWGLIADNLLAKKPEAKKKGEALLAKLHKVQVPLGVAAVVLGIIVAIQYNSFTAF